MAALPKKKTSKVRSKTRRANQRAVLPRLVRCAKCKTPKLPHHICPECGYYGRAKIINTKLDKKVTKTLDKTEAKAKPPKAKAAPAKKVSKPQEAKKVIKNPKRTGEDIQQDQQ